MNMYAIIALTLICNTIAEPNHTSDSQNWILNPIRPTCITKTGTRLPLSMNGKCGTDSACSVGQSCSDLNWCGTDKYHVKYERPDYTCGVEIPSIVEYTIEIAIKIVSYAVLGGVALFCGLFSILSSLVLFHRTVKWLYIIDLRSM